MMDIREKFLALHEVKFPAYLEVVVPGFDEPLRVKELNCGERDEFEQEHTKADGKNYRARWVAFTCIDQQGALVFGPKDIPEIATFPPSIIDPIVRAAVKINKLTPEDVADFEKNLNGQAGSLSAN